MTYSVPSPSSIEPATSDAGRVRSWTTLDPRTKVLLVLVTSVLVMLPGGLVVVPAALVLGVLLAVAERAWTRVLGIPAAACVAGAFAFLVPAALPWPVLGTLGTLALYVLRLVAVGGLAAHVVRTTSPTELTAGLRQARVPRAVTASLAVMLRFTPAVIAEARAVRDAMRLRGIGGARTMLRHPILTIEYFTVPLIASSLRVAEDLSAAALLRAWVRVPGRRPCAHHDSGWETRCWRCWSYCWSRAHCCGGMADDPSA